MTVFRQNVRTTRSGAFAHRVGRETRLDEICLSIFGLRGITFIIYSCCEAFIAVKEQVFVNSTNAIFTSRLSISLFHNTRQASKARQLV